MEINIGMSECHKNVDNYYGSTITVWIPRWAGREAFDGVEPLHGYNYKEIRNTYVHNLKRKLVSIKLEIFVTNLHEIFSVKTQRFFKFSAEICAHRIF